MYINKCIYNNKITAYLIISPTHQTLRCTLSHVLLKASNALPIVEKISKNISTHNKKALFLKTLKEKSESYIYHNDKLYKNYHDRTRLTHK